MRQVRRDGELVRGSRDPQRAVVYAAILLLFVLFGEYGETPFFYFQF